MSKYNWTEWPPKKRKGYDKMEAKREVCYAFKTVFENSGSIDDAEARTGIAFRDYSKWSLEIEEYDRKKRAGRHCPDCEHGGGPCQVDLED